MRSKSLLPCANHFAYVHGVEAGGEVGVHVSGHLVPEILRVKRRGLHRAALNHHVGLDIVRCAVLGVGRV